ncbi:MAG TPA: hypothetical protein VNO21_06845, partial [Polyangiaceae bacterium]|nr:hypothetical protein [Polyangiaceae bacterium]
LHSHPDGSFAAADDTALAYAKKACPARPKSILSKPSADAAAQKSSADDVACARMWGVSEADITAWVTKECRPLRPDAGAADAGKAACSGDVVCDDWPRFRAWLHAKPPLSLK